MKRGDGHGRRLSLYGFRLVPAKAMVGSRIFIRDLLFGAGAAAADAVFEMSPVSGCVSYRRKKKLYREEEQKNCSLPPSEAKATAAAKAFLAERHRAFASDTLLQRTFANTCTQGKPLDYPFSVIPPPRWLKHAGTELVRNDKHDCPDHWLCRFQVEVEAPGRRRLPVYGAWIEVRLGESAGPGGLAAGYEVVGFRSRWRPVYEHYRVEQFLSDTGQPEHSDHAEPAGHAHAGETTLLAYVLSDENVPQFNLLPYEASVSGEHHMSVLPASKDSLWVEMSVSKGGGKYRIQALVLGGSGNFTAYWGFWNPFAFEPVERKEKPKEAEPPEMLTGGAFTLKQESTSAALSPLQTGPEVQLSLTELAVDEGVVEVALHVFDVTLQNFIARRILLGIHAADTPRAAPAPATGGANVVS